MSKGHDTSVDYWSFGVLIYEMIVGKSPFFIDGSDQVSLFKRIVKCQYECPDIVCDDAQNLLKRLLKRRVVSRLGNLSNGYVDVKKHNWFRKSLSFNKLNARTLKAPWIPNVTNPFD